MHKRIGRTIFAVLIALSVAMLPAAAGFAAGGKIAAVSVSEAVPNCDHHHHSLPSDTKQKSADDCASMAGCALKCFNFTGLAISGIAFSSPVSAELKPVHTSGDVSSRIGSAPFRPPRS